MWQGDECSKYLTNSSEKINFQTGACTISK